MAPRKDLETKWAHHHVYLYISWSDEDTGVPCFFIEVISHCSHI